MKQFYFKNENWGDEWQEYLEHHYDKAFDHEDVARSVAESDWREDPCEPRNYEFSIEVKDQDGLVKKFNVIAEADVNFYANEVE